MFFSQYVNSYTLREGVVAYLYIMLCIPDQGESYKLYMYALYTFMHCAVCFCFSNLYAYKRYIQICMCIIYNIYNIYTVYTIYS